MGREDTSLFDSVHIPLYREYIEATGSHELAIVLNQLVFHDKWLSASQVKKYCLFDKSLGSVRLMLSRLVELGLVLRVRKNTDSDNPHDNHKYTAVHLYRAVPDLAIRLSAYEPQLVGMIDGYDLKTTPCMVEAAILNKFRQFVHEDKKTATFSSAELKRLLYSEKSSETMRLKLKSLISKGYIVPRHGFGRVYEYELNHAMLLNTRTPEVLAAQGNELLELFVCHHQVYHGQQININTQKSWLTSFRRMLQEGFDFAGIRHIIAYLPHDKEQLRIVKTPGKIRERFADLFALANVKLSRKRVRSYIYRLLHGLVTIRQPKPVIPISDNFHNGLEWLRRLGVYRYADGRYSLSGKLYKWWEDSSYGVYDVDFEDYVAQAQLLIHGFYTNPPSANSQKHRNKWLYYRLSDYMLEHRCVDKSAKTELNSHTLTVGDSQTLERNLVLTHVDADYFDTLADITAAAVDDEAEEDSDKYTPLYDALQALPERDRGIVMDYYGFDGISLNMEELAARYKLSISRISQIITQSQGLLAKILAPPDS